MPNHKSAKKRVRQTEKRNLVNRNNRSRLRTAIKKLRSSIGENNATETVALLPATMSIIDKMVNKGILHSNTADRYKARLSKHVARVSAAAAQ